MEGLFIRFETKAEAEAALKKIRSIARNCMYVTVSDVFHIRGTAVPVHSCEDMYNRGWDKTDLPAKPISRDDGWYIPLPPPGEIRAGAGGMYRVVREE